MGVSPLRVGEKGLMKNWTEVTRWKEAGRPKQSVSSGHLILRYGLSPGPIPKEMSQDGRGIYHEPPTHSPGNMARSEEVGVPEDWNPLDCRPWCPGGCPHAAGTW